MKLEFYTCPNTDKWQHAYIKWVEENRWFNLHERMIPTQDAKFHSTKLMLNEIGPLSFRGTKLPHLLFKILEEFVKLVKVVVVFPVYFVGIRVVGTRGPRIAPYDRP